jgi:RNA-splicing ligase RtcB
VDIGCGMLVTQLGLMDFDLEGMDERIHTRVPAGFNSHEKSLFAFHKIKQMFCYEQLYKPEHFENQLGTLGGGNHFIEIDKDDDGCAYLVIHSGSRNMGKQVADFYQKIAIEKCDGTGLPKDLCYLEGEDRDNYLHDMRICQEYASENRIGIYYRIMSNIAGDEEFETIHNYVSDDGLIRKGAVSAKKGEKFIVPINMRDGSLICIGKGNKDWNESAPHGAGRLMGRNEAKKTLSLEEFEETMKGAGVYSTTIGQSTLDEAPGAYKLMTDIVANIEPTADIVKIIRPIYNFKST